MTTAAKAKGRKWPSLGSNAESWVSGNRRVAPGQDRRQAESWVDGWPRTAGQEQGRPNMGPRKGRGAGSWWFARVALAAMSRVDLKGTSREAGDHSLHTLNRESVRACSRTKGLETERRDSRTTGGRLTECGPEKMRNKNEIKMWPRTLLWVAGRTEAPLMTWGMGGISLAGGDSTAWMWRTEDAYRTPGWTHPSRSCKNSQGYRAEGARHSDAG